MKFELFMARRYLARGRKSSFISIISLVSVIGIAIGVAALLIALSLLNGFQNDIRDKILSSSAHILITSRLGEGLSDYQQTMAAISEKFPQVRSIMPVVYGTVLIKGNSRDISGVVFRGLDLNRGKREPWLEKLAAGTLPWRKGDILVGRETAGRLNLTVGDSCLIIAPQPVITPGGIVPSYRRFRISGIFKSGLYEFDTGTVIANLAAAQVLFHLEGRIHYLQVNLTDLFAAESVAAHLRAFLPVHFSVITWRELNESLYSALKLEKTVLFFTLTLIIVVASLNIVAGLILLVMQKIKDIGILLSFGTPVRSIQKIFFIQGAIIGLVGTALGTILGLAFCALANRFQLIRIPSDIYQVSHVTFRTTLWDLVAVVGVSLLISFSATFIPARRAAAIQVVEAVKYE